MTQDTVINEDQVSHSDMANAIRALSMDAVQAANSGHPGAPMGMADLGTVLFTRYLKFDSRDPSWADRDRFILSNGHASMLLYSLLYLTGYQDMSIDQLRNFRQLGSMTAGHPEFGHTAGVETTTGPLGQGVANAVGMAIAERLLNSQFGDGVCDHRTYVFAGDGCLMEGVCQEAISLAGHLKLGKLILLFDDNQISIDGSTSISTSDDHQRRFEAVGWHTQSINGHNQAEIANAIDAAQRNPCPSMIACRTVIGFGSPNKQGSESTHGAPLGEEEIAATREKLKWKYDPFVIPQSILGAWRRAGRRCTEERKNWISRVNALDKDMKARFERQLAGRLPDKLKELILELKREAIFKQDHLATRQASKLILDVINPILPELIGGSADLTGSNLTKAKNMMPIGASDFSGNYIYYGVREHAMAAAMNGMALHGGIVPYGGTFLIFTDYCRPSIRLSALMRQRVIYVMTHDSIGLGEDGPTHQPVEHLASLRAIPNLKVFRPADLTETAECWELALRNSSGPSIIALTRQAVAPVRKQFLSENLASKGAYVLREAKGERKATIIASGSEIKIACSARHSLQKDGVPTAVISAPCLELFDQQNKEYKKEVLGPEGTRVAVEAAVGFGWEGYTGKDGAFIGMTSFGASGSADELYAHFGITVEAVISAVKDRI